MIYSNIDYHEAIDKSGLDYLYVRRDNLVQSFFEKMSLPGDKLNYLLKRSSKPYVLRKSMYDLPLCKTERYKKTFLPYVLFKQLNGK